MFTNLRSKIKTLIFKKFLEFFNSDKLEILGYLLNVNDDPSIVGKLDKVANFSAYQRNAWVAEMASTVPKGAMVLDAGAGQCQYKKLFSHTNYFSQDFAQYTGNGSGPLKETWVYEKLDYISDITSIPVDSSSFDVVLCTEVLEHVPEPISALRELSRVLKVDGKIFISAPLGSGVHQEPYHYYGGFSPYFYKYFLKQFGVEVVKITPIGGHFKNVAQELFRVTRELESHNALDEIERLVIQNWLSPKLHDMDAEYNVTQFTVGYLIEGIKIGK